MEEDTNKVGVDALYKHITKNMSAEQALKKLLVSANKSYEKLKFDKGKEVHPVIIIANATMDLGWDFALENKDPDDDVRGMVVGTMEYLEEVFKKEK